MIIEISFVTRLLLFIKMQRDKDIPTGFEKTWQKLFNNVAIIA